MSGHSKWSTIKHKKAKTDAQRGKMFTKVVKELSMAAKLGGADPEDNPRLRLAILKAKEVNMPKDNVQRAIQKGAGLGDDGSTLEEVMFEAYGPNGVGIIIMTLTDNRNRTVPSLKATLSRAGGNLANAGAVSYLFNKKGLIVFEPGSSEEDIIDIATENGADDMDTKEDGSIEVITDPQQFMAIRNEFDQAGIAYAMAELTMIPSTTIDLSDEDREKMDALIEKLEDDDDVQEVFSNY